MAQKTPNENKTWAWLNFHRPTADSPMLSPDTVAAFSCPMLRESVKWEAGATFNPAATVWKNKVVVLYRAEDNLHQGIGSRTSRIGYAWSDDGVHFTKRSTPVLYPQKDDQAKAETPGGCEDPRVSMTEDGLYVMFYTQWNRQNARLAVATSRDLIHWKKYGFIFAESGVKILSNLKYTKSASIVTTVKNGRQVIAKVNGKYMMYWGENFVNIATSKDLIHWTPMLDRNGNLLKVMVPRKGYFDSMLTECGPPAIITKNGILLFYNGKNSKSNGDSNYGANAYCAGQALFDINNPTKLVDRLDYPYFVPETPFEKSGQYVSGTVFTEGMALFKNKWYLYYGCADSMVGVAVRDASHGK